MLFQVEEVFRGSVGGIQSGKIRSGILDKSGFTANDVAEYRDSMRELVAVVSDDV